MALTAKSGPDVSFGAIIQGSTNGATGNANVGGYNDQRAPNVSDLGYALMDPRAFYQYQPGAGITSQSSIFGTDDIACFYNNRGYYDFVPVAISSIAIAAAATSSAAGSSAITLQAASSARGTYSINIPAPENGQIINGILTCDSSGPQFNIFGQSGVINTWNPSFGPGRCVAVSLTSYLDSPFVITGRDVYGYKISEAINISSNLGPNSSFGGISQKAFKFVTGGNFSSTPTSTGFGGIGFADQFGLPMYVPYATADLAIRISSAIVNSSFPVALSSANFINGSTRATQTSTTPDVRGIYISTTALTTNYRVQISVIPSASGAAAVTTQDMSGIFGPSQFSSF